MRNRSLVHARRVHALVQALAEDTCCLGAVSRKPNHGSPEPRPQGGVQREAGGPELAVLSYKAFHGRYSKPNFIRNDLDGRERQPMILRALRYRGGLHIDRLCSIGLGKFGFLLSARYGRKADQYSGAVSSIDPAAIPGIDHASCFQQFTNAPPLFQRSRESHRPDRTRLILRDHRFGGSPRRFRSDPAAGDNAVLLLKEPVLPAVVFTVRSLPILYERPDFTLQGGDHSDFRHSPSLETRLLRALVRHRRARSSSRVPVRPWPTKRTFSCGPCVLRRSSPAAPYPEF